ncbi:Nicastrin [Klebsormidium nitens]|uniref:Nicastrin n=1 Tax=Klebsormidium nitens TaxID=105231 RepID=A0A1Y1HQI4_KLENI|nr:Nicastrin [Klebsormidium nitens]|eukprot:GAQ80052.1 Nicastrin [Klebsormidium nitens]
MASFPRASHVTILCQLVFIAACILASCVEGVDSSSVVDVFRMVQYDLGGKPLGSRKAGLNQHVSSGLALPGADIARATIVMPVGSINETLFNEVLQKRIHVGSLLFLLPRNYGAQDDEEGAKDAHNLAALEQKLIQANLGVPVYFAYKNEVFADILSELKANDEAGVPASATSGGYRLVVKTPEGRKLPAPTLVNIQGWLRGALPSNSQPSAIQTIAIVASYDTFGAAPGLSFGAGSIGTAVVALLELARLFSKLYASGATHGGYNLLFLLTGGGPYDYDGTKQWLSSQDNRLLETVEFALCLDGLGAWGDGGLKLHVSRPPKEAAIQALYSTFTEVADGFGIPLEIVQKKVNLGNPRVFWEHEQFSRRRMVAGTLSGRPAPPEFLEDTGGIADTRARVDPAAVAKAVKFVAESLARHIYGSGSVEVFADNTSLAVSTEFVAHWLGLLGSTPRVAAFLSKTSPIVTALQKQLSEYVGEVSFHAAKLESDLVMYDASTAKMNIHKVASMTFDIWILLAVAAYLASLYAILHIATKGLDDFLGVFRKPVNNKKSKAL